MSGQCNDILQELESWYTRGAGPYLLGQTRTALQPLLDTAFGYHLLQLSPCRTLPLYEDCRINHRIYASARPGGEVGLLCEGDELPLETDSVDTLIALHSLEFSANPHQALREMQRVLTPQGHLILIGFNPFSLHGIAARLRGLAGNSLWREHSPVGEGRLTDWLHLLGCEVQGRHRLYHLPPVGSGRIAAWLRRLDAWSERHNFPTGGVYMVHAIKQVSALNTPRRALRLRSERLIGLAVPKAGAAPSPTPTAPTRTPVASRIGPGATGDVAA